MRRIKPSFMLCFNSSVVRLEEGKELTSEIKRLSFNSSVVRLEEPYCFALLGVPRFQFQCGAIGRTKHMAKIEVKVSFNSSVVRLEALSFC